MTLELIKKYNAGGNSLRLKKFSNKLTVAKAVIAVELTTSAFRTRLALQIRDLAYPIPPNIA